MNWNKEMILTTERICTYVKKYGFILLFSFLLGIVLLGINLYSNLNESDETEGKFTQQIAIIEKSEKPFSMASSAVGDCQIYLSLIDVQEKINAKLIEQENIIDNWNEIEVVAISGARAISLSFPANNEKIGEKRLDAIIEVLNEQLEKYASTVRLEKIGELSKESNDETSLVYLKDILLTFFVIFVGFMVVYLIIILDTHIASVEELKNICKCNQGICIGKKEQDILDNWIKSIDKKDALFILGSGTQEIDSYLENVSGDIINIDKYGSQDINMEKVIQADKYLVIKAMCTKQKEIERLLKINDLWDTEICGWVLLK